MATLVVSWCRCPHGDGSLHLAGSWCVGADGSDVGAASTPAVAREPRASIASAHRTGSTQPRSSFGVTTPLGRTTRFLQPY